ncbi:hypothetical protein [Nocardia brasiliensis]|uniref:hypothetical protein n=1 Tax=Nocardia brasiliensis TaxID=37326 RepID=UPI003D8C34EB
MDAFRALARVEGQAKSCRDQHGTVLAEFTPATDDDAIARYETTMFPRSGELAVSSNSALTRFFATTSPDTPDHAQEHKNYQARAAEYRRRQQNS